MRRLVKSVKKAVCAGEATFVCAGEAPSPIRSMFQTPHHSWSKDATRGSWPYY